ncbi:L-ascorbate metabolism protein UlaG (beta-lactamase superfamily) [Sporomusaceae bacterium BoRhaA]|uniref:MBL fold metallo-hydrolase n=1 Tax=Pelorhabdus rhamnosifermentans TaxID=2772457 RepID=UPI001C063FC0|nr:MBL fold metallo-hydrolase [Pelorhabdus rhamnosifermentans]MBU2700440.1 L-ascorbate metabolism protein UlaG (beta-lactamase superfamily) [Pelorhabdus rhamnosifermentans]
MKIKWFGQSCFMITSENGTKIVTDPYVNMLGYKLPEIQANIVTTSHNHKDHNNINAVKGKFEHIQGSGSFSKNEIKIKGVETFHDKVSGAKRGKNTIYNFNIDGINVCHCGDLGHILTSNQIEELGNVDILLLTIGGLVTINAANAVQVAKQLNPTVIIPMHYRTKALGLLGYIFCSVDKFISISGMKAKEYNELELNKANFRDYSGIAVLKYN